MSWMPPAWRPARASGQRHADRRDRRQPAEGAVLASVGAVFSLPCSRFVFNVVPGQSQSHAFSLLNTSGKEMEWKASSSVEWVTVRPAAGKLGPGQHCELTVTGKPAGDAFARVEGVLTISEDKGAKMDLPAEGYVVPAYQPPQVTLSGSTVQLDKLTKADVKSFVNGGRKATGYAPNFAYPEPARGIKIYVANDQREYTFAMQSNVTFEATWKLEGKGFKGFAAEVGPSPGWAAPTNLPWTRDLRLYFEIYVDGQCRAWSGPMGPTDKPRRLALDGLENAKEIRMVTRQATGADSEGVRGRWGEPAFYK